MSLTTPDTRAVVAAVDRLTTQVRRLADGASTPVVVGEMETVGTCDASTHGLGAATLGPCILRYQHDGPVHQDETGVRWSTVVATADDGPTPDFTSPIAGRIEVRWPCPYCADHQMIPRTLFDEHVARLHPDVRTGGPGSPADPDAPARVITHWGPLSEQRFEELRDNARQLTDWITERAQQAPAADEDAQRAIRRERLHNLLARADRSHLTPGETAALRDLVDAEVREADTGRAVAAGNLRNVQLLYADLRQAQAAIERVRALLDTHLGPLATAAVRRALDGTDQPTTKA